MKRFVLALVLLPAPALAAVGVDYDDVTALLEREGVEKFEASWAELLETVQSALDSSR